MAVVSVAAALLWCFGAAVVLAPLLRAAARQLAAEIRAAVRLLCRVSHRSKRR